MIGVCCTVTFQVFKALTEARDSSSEWCVVLKTSAAHHLNDVVQEKLIVENRLERTAQDPQT